MSERIEIDLDKIERVAMAAPHEEWIAIDGGFGDSEVLITTECRHASGRVAICEMDVDYSGSIGEEQRASRDFIIAANPAVVLELVRRLRRAEALAEKAVAKLEQVADRLVGEPK